MDRRAFCRVLLIAPPLAALAQWRAPPPLRRIRVVRTGLPPWGVVFRKINEGITPSRSFYVREVSEDDGRTWRPYRVGCAVT